MRWQAVCGSRTRLIRPGIEIAGHDKDPQRQLGKRSQSGLLLKSQIGKAGGAFKLQLQLPRFYNRKINTAKLA
jgi:hypothetical protein